MRNRNNKVKNMPGLQDPAPSSSVVQTFGEVLPRLMVESILDPDHPDRLCLETWDGRKAKTAPRVDEGVTYVAGSIARGLMQAVHFPPASKSFGSAEKLIFSMRGLLWKYAHVLPDAASLLVAFALASWFTDCTPVIPVLCLLGPENAVRLVLRLLGRMCRRPVLLADLDLAALSTLPNQLCATLLINQRQLGRRVARALFASNYRHFHVARGSGWLNLHAAKAFSCEGWPKSECGVRVALSPAQDPLPLLTDAEELVITQDFQARLLRYRMVYHARVRGAKVDISAFVPAMRDEALAWLAPICDCPELSQSVLKGLLRQSQEAAGARFFDPKCVAIEAALFFCHKGDTKHFFVGELAGTVNTLLQGRHEDSELSEKKAGLVLGELGIYGERVTKGYKIVLTDAVREQIHQLAHDYQVLPVQDGVSRCRHCSKGKTTCKESNLAGV
jgi:hypothetical protein